MSLIYILHFSTPLLPRIVHETNYVLFVNSCIPLLSTGRPHSGYLENACWNTFLLASVWCWLKFPSGEVHFCVSPSSCGLLVWCRAILSILVQRESPSLDFIRVLKIRDGRECSPEVVYCPFSPKSPERTLAVPQELQSGVKAQWECLLLEQELPTHWKFPTLNGVVPGSVSPYCKFPWHRCLIHARSQHGNLWQYFLKEMSINHIV